MTTTLIDHLLEGRHRFPNQVIIDCLALARMDPSPDERFTWEVLAAILGVNEQPRVSNKLHKLKRVGLLDFESGDRGDPGYRITRVGPS